MNKVLAEIIAGMIPHKMTRNRWRGILRFGLFNAFRLRREIRKNRKEPDHYLAVCVIAKNEGPYFKEWLDWHISKGVDRFYIYDNESTDETRDILAPYIEQGIVEYIPFPGYRRQLAAYDDCLRRHRFDTRWLAFIDMDEFIVPLKDETIPDFLHRFEDAPVVEINWLIYGSGGERKKRPGSMMERFRLHSRPEHPLNHHVKSIVNPRRVYGMIGCHEAARINGKAVDSHGERIRTAWRDREPQQDVIRINHYAVRSYEEFAEKQLRGRASGRDREVKEEYFTRFDLNDIDETQPNGIPGSLDPDSETLLFLVDSLNSPFGQFLTEWSSTRENVVLIDNSINARVPTLPLAHIAVLSSEDPKPELIRTLAARGVPVIYHNKYLDNQSLSELQALGAAFPADSRDSVIRLADRFYFDRKALATASSFAEDFK